MVNIYIEYDEIRCCAILKKDDDRVYFDLIRNYFSYIDEDSMFRKKKSRKYLITEKGRFSIGLIWQIHSFIVSKNLPIKLKMSKGILKHLVNPIDADIKETEYKLRDYQEDSIKSFLKVGNGIQLIGTGGGKTLIMATILETMYHKNKNLKAIVVVPDIGLLKQTFDDFKKYKCSFSFSKYGNKHELDDSSNVVICNASIIVSRSDRNGWIDNRNVLLYDEVHKFNAGTKIAQIFNYRNFDHKVGFTGSMPSDPYNKNFILGYFGKIIYTKKSKELRDEDYLTNVAVQFIKFNHRNAHEIYEFKTGMKPNENFIREIEFLNGSTLRNDWIKKLSRSTDKNILILVERIEQGEILRDHLFDLKNKNVTFVRGDVSTEDRAKIINDLETSDNNVCIAMSKIFSTGISVNNIHFLIFSNLGKKDVKTIQSIGRGLRLHENKRLLIIFDLYDNLIYSDKHAEERKKIYDMEKITYKVKEITE